ncbi:Wzz/FepE/Etk N-terminal domain-containing protein [Propionivibrio dicarboxylicus]|uniref:G-rich domain on putative tyrosine kinase n=1 Tax=Propionivibrio dicarboxylicus TaxID=83767 RepID=A0A1G8NQ68_9RHOO|nr:Wzz/FepE/Etk N-terminal domain-containing protein [Propionivibrio dicarboxylicus]SDH67458.1 G-rich domain on putative tyrosine kinase [Propionivibrio dicarboxylicus]SDI82353.1 G-rich domain on putative tyrosine kinase [Propionivibrio dicarboxylicus]
MTSENTGVSEAEMDDEIDLFELGMTLVQNKWIIALFAALSFSLATGLAFYMTPKYEAKVTATFADEGKSGGGMGALAGQLGGLAEMAGVSVGGGGSKDASLAYLKSRVLLEGFIKDNDLMPIFYAKQWDAANKKWLSTDPEKMPTLWKAYELFSKRILAVAHDKKTNLITLTITWKDREQAVAWANDLVKMANANLRQKTIDETRLSIGYLEKELQKTPVVDVQQTIYRVMENQIKTMMMANTQEQFAFKVIDPAAIVDENAYVSPKRALMMALGALGGLFVGVVFVFVRQSLRQRRLRRSVTQ